eukprot:354470-Chlamydomonas_euryale.AAC.10
MQAQMELEQRAHQAAVEKYVNEVEARGRALVELQEKDDKLVQAALSHAEVIAQRDQLLSEKVCLGAARSRPSLGPGRA